MNTLIQGFVFSLGLIAAIGAQNAFLIKQGLLKQHVLPLVLLFFASDAILMGLGIFGVGTILAKSLYATLALAIFGGLFLLVYGYHSAKSAIQGGTSLDTAETSGKQSLTKAVSFGLAVTLLNPHVYIDTVLLVGGIGVTLDQTQKVEFLIGAVSASLVWFATIGFGARLLIPYFKKEIMWRIFDTITALIMWFIAFGLFKYAYELIGQL